MVTHFANKIHYRLDIVIFFSLKFVSFFLLLFVCRQLSKLNTMITCDKENGNNGYEISGSHHDNDAGTNGVVALNSTICCVKTAQAASAKHNLS